MTIRQRVTLSVLSLFLSSCAPAVKAPDLPQSVSPGWQLNGVREKSPAAAWEGDYAGPGKARVRIWSIHGTAEGLDRVQKWRPEANTVVFYGERYFAAVDWTGADRVQAGSLVRAIERAIGSQPDTRY
jgi:hypothetical protein